MTTELAKRMGVEQKFTEGRTQEGWMRYLHELSRKAIRICRTSIPSVSRGFTSSATRKGIMLPIRHSVTIRRQIRWRPRRAKLRSIPRRWRKLPPPGNSPGDVIDPLPIYTPGFENYNDPLTAIPTTN